MSAKLSGQQSLVLEFLQTHGVENASYRELAGAIGISHQAFINSIAALYMKGYVVIKDGG